MPVIRTSPAAIDPILDVPMPATTVLERYPPRPRVSSHRPANTPAPASTATHGPVKTSTPPSYETGRGRGGPDRASRLYRRAEGFSACPASTPHATGGDDRDDDEHHTGDDRRDGPPECWVDGWDELPEKEERPDRDED